MRNRTLLHTNILVCVIITIGFAITSFVSYRSNFGIFQNDIEKVSTLTSDGIYSDIDDAFSQPVSVSLTMANDSLLKNFLKNETSNLNDKAYLREMQDYLSAYREKYSYDSVFLVSARTNRYYHFNGVDRVLTPENPENDWYYSFIKGADEYSLNVDNDEALANNITVFVNCIIRDTDGTVMGVVGVGLKVDSLQEMLKSYEDKYGITAYLIGDDGKIELSSTNTGHENVNLFDTAAYAGRRDEILGSTDTKETFWYSQNKISGYVVAQYEPNLKWHLVVENDTSAVSDSLAFQLYQGIITIFLIILIVLLIITMVIRRYNERIIELTVSQELEYERLLRDTTDGLYDETYEFDVTRNCAGGEKTRQFFQSLGFGPDAESDDVMRYIAERQVKEEYRDAYLSTFLSENVIAAYNNGITNLIQDFMLSYDDTGYHWARVSARIFYWNSDKSIRMIVYRKNIDDEKKHEFELLESIQKDSMTGLCNKRATEERIAKILSSDSANSVQHAILILDIDNFKMVNDGYGHKFGDSVLIELASELQAQFSERDVVGRIGGDEFLVLISDIENEAALEGKLHRVCERFTKKNFGADDDFHVSCSIGVSLFPSDGDTYAKLYERADRALYFAKAHGKNSFKLFNKITDERSFNVNPRDLQSLLNATTDCVIIFAYTNTLQMLYFNQKCVDFSGTPAEILSSPDYDALSQVYSEDRDAFCAALNTAILENKAFEMVFRFVHRDGHLFKVKMKAIFSNELYEEKYPILYAMFMKQ
ncbi:MAG: diguanylate cyclase [Clostridia bacterium]